MKMMRDTLARIAVGMLAIPVAVAGELADFERRAVEADSRPPVLRADDRGNYSTNRLTFALNNGLAMTRGGRIWASWISGGDGPGSFTAASWSDDGGATWTDTKFVIDGHDGTTSERTNIIGTFWLDPTGQLRCYTDQSLLHFDGRAGFWESVCQNPDDANPVWSEFRRIGNGHVMNKPIVLSNGDWAMAAYLNGTWDAKGSSRLGAFRSLDPERGATCFVSTDRGQTWEKRGTVKFPAEDRKGILVEDWQEAQLVELRDGTLRMFARVIDRDVGCLMAADSKDGGRTFSAARRLTSMDNTNARFQIQRLGSGRLIFVKHGVPDAFSRAWHGRRQLTAYLSDDDGKTWRGGLVLDWGDGSYPDLFQAPDGLIYVSHDRGRATKAEIRLHRFTEEDVLARRIVSANGRLDRLVMRAMNSAYNRQKRGGGRAEVRDFPVAGKDGAAIQRAIDAAAEAGGGRVVVGPGEYRSASLRLRSHVDLHLEKGAVLVGSAKSADYFDFPDSVCSVKPEHSAKVFLYGWDLEDVAITGEGVIEGQGPQFFDRTKLAFAGRFWGKPPHPRPRMVQLVRCRNVRLEGVTFKDSPGWTMLVRLCTDVTVDGIRVLADQRIINSDGIDFDGCRRVRVRRSTFKTGDDCLIVRAMREAGSNEPIVCEDIVFEDCDLDSACQTIRMGCPSDDVIRNVRIRNIRARGCNGINFDYPVRYLRPDDEGYMNLSDVLIENYSGDFTDVALRMVVAPGVKLRRIADVTIRGLKVSSRNPLHFVGNADTPLTNIRLTDSEVTTPAGVKPWVAVATEPLQFKNCTFNGVRVDSQTVVTPRGERQELIRPKGSWEAAPRARSVENLIWDDRPAHDWEKSWYPLGNGRLGCMVDGGTESLRVQFNVDSFWTGDKNITGPVDDGNADKNYATMGAFQNFGELKIDLPDVRGVVTDYRRTLDLSQAVYDDRFKRGDTRITRRVFATAADDAIVIVVRAEKGLSSLALRLCGAHGEKETSAGAPGTSALFGGQLPNGLKYAARADAFAAPDGARIIVLRAATGTDALSPAATPDLAKLLSRHRAEYRGYYDRCVLDLGTGEATVPTRVRLERVRAGGHDPALIALQFNFGRYLLIGSSRPGTLPANLQGIWCNQNDPAWHSDYHTNINLQMNYWGADAANLSDCFLPFSDWMMQSLPVVTEVTRATFPKSRGYAYQTSANAVGGGGWRWNYAGAPWMAAQCFDHYLFTRDDRYLRETVWPLMKGAAEFLTSELLKERADGSVVVTMGWSPEHGPREDGVAHDQQIARELFRDILAAAKILKIDDAFVKEIARLEPKLRKDRIGRWGQLQEWEADRDVKGDEHRHTSHLYAVYPGTTINRSTPELFAAAKVALDGRKLTGDAHRSWTWPWRSALWARLGEPDKAGEMLECLQRYNTCENLFTIHPPYQIDGNFGMVGAVGEILLNSEKGRKMPSAWGHGSVKGLRTREGETVSFAW